MTSNAFVPPPPEIERVEKTRVRCNGGGGALGHPMVYYTILPEVGFVECKYCDKKFVLVGSPADKDDR